MATNAADRKYFYYSASRVLLLLLVIFISIIPFALNGLWFDDSSINSLFWELQIRDISLLQYLRETIHAMLDAGRLTPLLVLQTFSLSYWIQDVHIFRFAHLASVLVHICTFVWLLRRLKLDWYFIGLWLLLLVGIFQARDYHDPIASYGFFLQTQGILLTFAILSLLTWIETLRDKWLILSSIFSLIILLMYEINIVYYPIALGLLSVSAHTTRLKIRALLILSVPLVIYALMTAYLRYSVDVNYSGIQVGSADLMLATYVKQFIAAFPGVFYLLRWREVFTGSELFSSFTSNPLAWMLMVASLYSVFVCVSNNKQTVKSSSRKFRELSIIAFCLIFIPPVFVAISSKYQAELRAGLGYLPVYYAYFGASLILAALIAWVSERFVILQATITIVLSTIITVNYLVNLNVIDKMDQRFVEPRISLVQALESGLLNDLHDGDYLIVDRDDYHNRGFFYRHSGKNLIIEDVDVVDRADIGPTYYRLEHEGESPYKWKVIPPGNTR